MNGLFAETNVSGGAVTGIWTVAGSPYLIEGDIVVPSGSTLTIEPGVVVEFQNWYKLTVNGTLLAAGTNEQRIVFTATPPGPGEPGWVGIDIIGATDFTLLEYCVIENGRASAATPNDRGGGIYILNANPVIRNCTIRNNSVSRWGGAIYAENANPQIINCTITDNQAGYASVAGGGGLYFLNSHPVVKGNVISHNTVYSSGGFTSANAAGGGIYLSGSDAYLEGNIITGNTITAEGNTGTYCRGAALYLFESDPVLVGNTIGDNKATYYSFGGQGAVFVYASRPAAVNNIFRNSTTDEIYLYSQSTFLSAYNDVQDGQAGITAESGSTVYWQEGNIGSDPLFTDPAGNDYSLQPGSPAINTGTAYYQWQNQVLVDLPSGSYTGPAPDLGAVESISLEQPNIAPIASASGSPDIGTVPLAVQFSSNGSVDPDGTIAAYAWDFGDGAVSSAANPLHVFNAPGTFNVALLVTDNNGAVAEARLEITALDALPHLFIGSQQITRLKIFGSIYRARDIVLITDQNGNPVPNALVAIGYTGPNQGAVTGYTANNGKVTFLTNYSWTSAGTWCFTVTGISKDGFVFNPQESETRACEGN